ncbi:MAG: ribbon-helix-helix domain-containing protein [Candidatus Xenobia bacterium]
MKMVRKQIYLTQWQEDRLLELARKAGRPEAEVIRRALDAYLLALDELPADHPLSGLAAIGSGAEGPGAAQHDRIIYEC